jgi:hypothetical protein
VPPALVPPAPPPAPEVELSRSELPFHSVADRIALSDARVRATVSYAIIAAFLIVNLATLYGIYILYRSDADNLRAKLIGPDQRVIDTSVVIALLGATTVQLGAMAVIMAKYLFPLPRP